MTLKAQLTQLTIAVAALLLAGAASAQLPDPGMDVDPLNTAVLVTDPQNDFLSPEGVTWGIVGKSVTDNKTVEHVEVWVPADDDSAKSDTDTQSVGKSEDRPPRRRPSAMIGKSLGSLMPESLARLRPSLRT